MHNIKSNFEKVFHTIKSLNLTGFNEDGNICKPGNSPLFTDVEVINLALVAEFHELCTKHNLDDPIIMLRDMIGTKGNMYAGILHVKNENGHEKSKPRNVSFIW